MFLSSELAVGAQGLILALRSEITPKREHRWIATKRNLRIILEARENTTGKAPALHVVQSLEPHMVLRALVLVFLHISLTQAKNKFPHCPENPLMLLYMPRQLFNILPPCSLWCILPPSINPKAFVFTPWKSRMCVTINARSKFNQQ